MLSISSRRLQEADQLFAHDLRLFLLRPVTGTIHQLRSHELRVAVPSNSLGSARDPVGAPILFAGDEPSGDVDGATGESELLGDVGGKRRAPVPIVVQGAGP